jgi:hypothetical protein
MAGIDGAENPTPFQSRCMAKTKALLEALGVAHGDFEAARAKGESEARDYELRFSVSGKPVEICIFSDHSMSVFHSQAITGFEEYEPETENEYLENFLRCIREAVLSLNLKK